MNTPRRRSIKRYTIHRTPPSLTPTTSAIFLLRRLAGLDTPQTWNPFNWFGALPNLFRTICCPFAILFMIVVLLLWVHPIFRQLWQFLLIFLLIFASLFSNIGRTWRSVRNTFFFDTDELFWWNVSFLCIDYASLYRIWFDWDIAPTF